MTVFFFKEKKETPDQNYHYQCFLCLISMLVPFQSQLNPPLCSANQQPPGKEPIQGAVFVFVQVRVNPSTRLEPFPYKRSTKSLSPALRDDVVDLTDCYQYEDSQTDDLDAFVREPYILHFKPRNTGETMLGKERCVISGQTLCLGPHCKEQTGLSRQSRL